MFDKLKEIESRYDELESEMADPEVIADQLRYKKVTKAHSDLEDIVTHYRELKKVMGEIQATGEMLRDKLDLELRELAEAELTSLEQDRSSLEDKLRVLLLPPTR